MESKLFSVFDLNDSDNKEFAEALGILLSISLDQWSNIINALPAWVEANTNDKRKTLLEELMHELGLAGIKILPLMSLASFFLDVFSDDDFREDSPSLWGNDLTELGVIASEDTQKFVEYTILLKENALDKVKNELRKNEAEAGVIPIFVGASTTIEMRAVFKDSFKWGTDIAQFQPKLVATVPIVTVNIRVDSGLNKFFYFQATPDTLNYLIDELRAAQKSVNEIIKFAKFTDVEVK